MERTMQNRNTKNASKWNTVFTNTITAHATRWAIEKYYPHNQKENVPDTNKKSSAIDAQHTQEKSSETTKQKNKIRFTAIQKKPHSISTHKKKPANPLTTEQLMQYSDEHTTESRRPKPKEKTKQPVMRQNNGPSEQKQLPLSGKAAPTLHSGGGSFSLLTSRASSQEKADEMDKPKSPKNSTATLKPGDIENKNHQLFSKLKMFFNKSAGQEDAPLKKTTHDVSASASDVDSTTPPKSTSPHQATLPTTKNAEPTLANQSSLFTHKPPQATIQPLAKPAWWWPF
jgi:hypothetical protein